MKLLIVDDDPGISQMLSRVFSVDGYEVETASTGAKALETLASGNIGLALVDYHLDDMEAPAILEKTKENNWDIPIIVMSGLGEQEDTAQVLQQGAVALLDKPFDLMEIRGLVRDNMKT
ncbi:MAG: response regulator [Planctomycetota bacterium]|jgi:DNA-binding response OmpR family regulator|nr:response regulator [Planctomycetota bacterium]